MGNEQEVDKRHEVRMAAKHWEWLESILAKVYTDAFIHGYKHGGERPPLKAEVMNEQEYEEFKKRVGKYRL